MLRMWWIIWYLVRYNSPIYSSIESWYRDEVKRHDFVVRYLILKKHYRENWKDTIIRWISLLFKKDLSTKNPRALARARKQRKEIDDIIDNCISRDFIFVRNASDNIDARANGAYLTIDYRSRNFLKPLNFLNTVFAEYGYVISTFFGFGGASLLYLIIGWLWGLTLIP